MNNLVKFLILNFLILWSASLNADKDLAYIKCDNLQLQNWGPLDTRKRELIVELDLADKYWYALQWIDGSKNISHFWRGVGSLSLLGNNDEFYELEHLWIWETASSEEMLIKVLELIPLRAVNGLNEAFLSVYFSFQNLKSTSSLSPRLNRETLILSYPDLSYPESNLEDYKCRLIDVKAAEAEYEKIEFLFEDNWTETLNRNEELKAKEQKEKEEQRKRFKL